MSTLQNTDTTWLSTFAIQRIVNVYVLLFEGGGWG